MKIERRIVNQWIPILVNIGYQGYKGSELCLYAEYGMWEHQAAMRKIFSWWGVMDNLGGLSQYSIDMMNKRQRDRENYKGELPMDTVVMCIKIFIKMKRLNDYNVEFDPVSDGELTEYSVDIVTDFDLDKKDFEFNKQVEDLIIDKVANIMDKDIESKKDNKPLSFSKVVLNTKWLVKSYKIKDKNTITVTLSYGLKRDG